MTAFELIEANGLTLHGDIEHFAELVRADEREACADVVEFTPWSEWFRTDCATAIRNRGNT